MDKNEGKPGTERFIRAKIKAEFTIDQALVWAIARQSQVSTHVQKAGQMLLV